MVETTKPYEYQAIEGHGSVRLIELQPSASTTDVIQCKMIQKTLKQIQEDIVTPYTALSYVWGNPNDTTSILVDKSSLQITKSLDCALRHSRDTEKVMYIWADGICINQNDNIEKAQQVLLMGEIYSIVHHTVICLGPGDSTSGDVLRRVQECFDNETYSSVELDGALVRGLRKILNSPWFFRIWVLQELVLSRDPRIQWGRARCTWEALCQMVNMLSLSIFMPEIRDATRESGRAQLEDTVSVSVLRSHYAITPVLNNLDFPQHQASTSSNFQIHGIPKPHVLERMQAAKDAHDHDFLEHNENRRRHLRRSSQLSSDRRQRRDLKRLLEIITSRAGLGVSDSRDMVYAHLGLAKHASIQVDYTKTIAEVYQDLALEAINVFGNLRILGYVLEHNLDQRGTLTFSKDGITASAEEKLASWVPNWTVPHTRVSYSIMEHVGYSFDSYGGSFQYCVMSRPPLLCIKGWVIGTLSEVGPVLGHIETLREGDIPLDFPRVDNPSPDWLMDIPGLPQKAVQLMWERYLALRSPLQSHTGDGHARHVIDHLCGRRFITSERSIIDGRRLAILESEFKRLSLVPMCADNGDRVCFFDGCPVPFVIRDTDTLDRSISDQILKRMNTEDNYAEHLKPVKLVGECFADDAMYGNDWLYKRHPWEWITIC
jgi:hypothetical protein